jgi:hypothetical protein
MVPIPAFVAKLEAHRIRYEVSSDEQYHLFVQDKTATVVPNGEAVEVYWRFYAVGNDHRTVMFTPRLRVLNESCPGSLDWFVKFLFPERSKYPSITSREPVIMGRAPIPNGAGGWDHFHQEWRFLSEEIRLVREYGEGYKRHLLVTYGGES